MAKLKLGTIADDRPVKLTVELSAALHRDLVAYGHALARETGPRRGRACKAGRADAGALHGDGPRLRQAAADDIHLREGGVSALCHAGTLQSGQR